MLDLRNRSPNPSSLNQGIVLNVERAQLQALLPEGYEVAEDVQPTILFEVMNLRKLPWLAGRGEQHE